MNPTIAVAPRDTGALTLAGHTITRTTGVGIVGGGIAGSMIGGKKHRVIGAIVGIIGGFFAGRYSDDERSKAGLPGIFG